MVIEMRDAPFDKNLLIEFGRLRVTVNKELAHDGNPEYIRWRTNGVKFMNVHRISFEHANVNKGESIA